MTVKASIHDYAFEQMNRLLAKLTDQVHRAAQTPGPDEIHDLRVSVRRFSQALELFAGFLPKKQVKEIRGMLKDLMRLTSAIRDRDITLEFLKETGHAGYVPRVEKERGTYERQFTTMLRRWTKQDVQTQWRSGLALRSV
jgi:CHAD domain-containing protein